MAEVKGVLINAWIQFLKARFRIDTVAEAIEKLDPGDRKQLAGSFLDSSWYSFDSQRLLSIVTRIVAPKANRDLSVELGYFIADYAFNKVYRNMISTVPQKQLELSWIEEFLFRGLRRLEGEMTGVTSCRLRWYYESMAEFSPGLCGSTVGFAVRDVELAGGSNVKAGHPITKCISGGNDCCEVTLEWTEAESSG